MRTIKSQSLREFAKFVKSYVGLFEECFGDIRRMVRYVGQKCRLATGTADGRIPLLRFPKEYRM